MSDPGSLIPINDEQAKAIQEALKILQGMGSFLKDTVGTIPEDLVGILLGDWLRVRRAENLERMFRKAQERLNERKIKTAPPSISLARPLMIAAADEDRDELQDLWARLLAAAADPARAKSFRLRFITVAKEMDPLDAAVLQQVSTHHDGRVTGAIRNQIADALGRKRDEVDVSIDNLSDLRLLGIPYPPDGTITHFGREFLRAISD
jgi:hypothetical protein